MAPQASTTTEKVVAAALLGSTAAGFAAGYVYARHKLTAKFNEECSDAVLFIDGRVGGWE